MWAPVMCACRHQCRLDFSIDQGNHRPDGVTVVQTACLDLSVCLRLLDINQVGQAVTPATDDVLKVVLLTCF